MKKIFITLFGLLTFSLLAGCYADWNHFEQGVNKAFVEDPRFSDLECDTTGCYLCENGFCEEYSCDTTNQCPQGYVCTIDQQCLPGLNSPVSPVGPSSDATSCSSHSECGPEELCSLDGTCVPRLSEPDEVNSSEQPSATGVDENAADGEKAIPLPDHPNDVCVVNSDCGEGICLNAECFFSCSAEATCPSGQMCDNGQCLPIAADEHECTFNGECGPSRMCIEGLCHTVCEEDSQCGQNEFCGEGLCKADTAPVIQCSGPGSCAEGSSCVNGKCLNPCSATALCGDNFSCEYGFCHQQVFCLESADCDAGTNCLDGRCQ